MWCLLVSLTSLYLALRDTRCGMILGYLFFQLFGITTKEFVIENRVNQKYPKLNFWKKTFQAFQYHGPPDTDIPNKFYAIFNECFVIEGVVIHWSIVFCVGISIKNLPYIHTILCPTEVLCKHGWNIYRGCSISNVTYKFHQILGKFYIFHFFRPFFTPLQKNSTHTSVHFYVHASVVLYSHEIVNDIILHCRLHAFSWGGSLLMYLHT